MMFCSLFLFPHRTLINILYNVDTQLLEKPFHGWQLFLIQGPKSLASPYDLVPASLTLQPHLEYVFPLFDAFILLELCS